MLQPRQEHYNSSKIEDLIKKINDKNPQFQFDVTENILDYRYISDKLNYYSVDILQKILDLFISEVDGDFISPLSKFPLKTGPYSDIDLIGDDRIDTFSKIINEDDDLLLVGRPGIGKTFILQKMAENKDLNAYFIEENSKYNLTRAIKLIKPDIIFIDDAHRAINLIEKVFQIRTLSGENFRIIVTSWPIENLSRVIKAGFYDETKIINLQPFTKDELAELITKIIEYKNLIRQYAWEQLIIDYSNGLPGLAVTLLDTCIKTGGKEVLEGTSILTFLADISLETRSSIEWIKTKKILACLSLYGKSGAKISQLSNTIGLPTIEINTILESFNYSGIIHHEWGITKVRPRALRAALVKEEFLAKYDQNQDLLNKISNSSESPNDIIDVILDAIRFGGSIPVNYLYSLMSRATVNDLWERFYYYFPDNIEQGIIDFPNTREASIKPGLSHIPQEILPHLLEIASNDNRPTKSNPDHVLRKLERWLYIDSQNSNTISKRKIIVESLRSYTESNGDPRTIINVICIVMSPKYNVTEIPPGSGNKVEFGTGIFSIDILDSFQEFWGEVYSLLSSLPDEFIIDFINFLYEWVQPSISVNSLSSDFVENMRNIAEYFIRDIAQLIKDHPALIRRLERFQSFYEKDLGIKCDIPQEKIDIYEILFPKHQQYLQRNNKKKDNSIENLANEYIDKGMEITIEDMSWAKNEAYIIKNPWPDLLPNFFSCIANKISNPLDWYQQMISNNLSNYISPFLQQAVLTYSNGWENILIELLDNNEMMPIALQIILGLEDPPKELLNLALDKVNDINPDGIKSLCIQKKVSIIATEALLQCKNSDISIAAAIGEWWREPKNEVRSEIKGIWENSIRETNEYEYGLLEIFKEKPQFILPWISKAYFGLSGRFAYADEELVKDAISLLDEDDRKQLIRIIITNNNQEIYEINLLKTVINGSLILYKFLLDITNLEDHKFYILSPLNTIPSEENWPEMALLAMEKGVNRKELLGAAFQPQFHIARLGELSHQYKEILLAFKRLETDEDKKIRKLSEEGQKIAEEKISLHKKREKERDTYGWE